MSLHQARLPLQLASQNLPALNHKPANRFLRATRTDGGTFLSREATYDTSDFKKPPPPKNNNNKKEMGGDKSCTLIMRSLDCCWQTALCLLPATQALSYHCLSSWGWTIPGARERMRQSLHSEDLGSFKITLKHGHLPKNLSLIYFIISSILPKSIYKFLHLMHTENLANNVLFLEDSFAWQFCRLYSTSLLINSN